MDGQINEFVWLAICRQSSKQMRHKEEERSYKRQQRQTPQTAVARRIRLICCCCQQTRTSRGFLPVGTGENEWFGSTVQLDEQYGISSSCATIVQTNEHDCGLSLCVLVGAQLHLKLIKRRLDDDVWPARLFQWKLTHPMVAGSGDVFEQMR